MIKNQGYKYIMLILTLIPYTNDFYEKKNGFLLGIFFGLIFIIIDCPLFINNYALWRDVVWG